MRRLRWLLPKPWCRSSFLRCLPICCHQPKMRRLESTTYEMPILSVPCFDIHTECRGCVPPASLLTFNRTCQVPQSLLTGTSASLDITHCPRTTSCIPSACVFSGLARVYQLE